MIMLNFLEKLHIKNPVMQAPMAGASNADFVVRACELGVMGLLGAGMMSPCAIDDEINKIKSSTNQPFLVNLMVLSKNLTHQLQGTMPDWLSQKYKSLGVEAMVDESPAHDFLAQFEVLLKNPVPVASFTFGIITKKQVDDLHRVGSLVVGTANCRAEALAWQEIGADAVVLQGLEAGGHQGGWLNESRDGRLTTFELLTECRDLKIDVIAAGGISTAEKIQKALSLGASAVAIGTLFLTTEESVVHESWKKALLSAKGGDTRLTRLFSGKLARGVVNGYMQEFCEFDQNAPNSKIPIYPTLNAMTKSLRAYGTRHGYTDLMSLWAGMGVEHCRQESMQALIDRLSID